MNIVKKHSIKPLQSLRYVCAAVVFMIAFGANAQTGEDLFKQNCASCHAIDKKVTGPALKGAVGRWEENSSKDNLYKWVKNSQAFLKTGDAYANALYKEYGKSVMTSFEFLTNEDIDAIFEYVETYEPPVVVDKGPGDGDVNTPAPGDAPSGLWIYALAVFLFIVAVAAAGVRRQLQKAEAEKNGEEVEDTTYMQEVKAWIWKNKGFSFIAGLFLILAALSFGIRNGGSNSGSLFGIGVTENYKPEQPIAFSHKIHAGDQEIDCKYCHNSAEKSRHAGIPTVNVCMNCHKVIGEGKTTGTNEIDKIYDAAGFDRESGKYMEDAEKTPIVWNKVHNLPDLSYFNHSQHVKVGGLDCQNCHGDMKKETVARVMPIEELNALEGNVDLGPRNTLTMGWCIECHGQKDVDLESAGGYYEEIHKRLLNDKELYQQYKEDGAITVSELGGWECAKCHY